MAIRTTAESLGRSEAGVVEIVRAILTPLASLRLTVALLAISTFVVWAITLQQATLDIWELKRQHFSGPFVSIPAQTFLPAKWFPAAPQLNFSLVLPSGFTLIIAMLINVTAAHVLRFKVKATGAKLYLGIAVLIAAGGLTWTIIFNGQDPQGFQGQPPIPWESMWVILQIAVLGLAIGSIFAAIAVSKERIVERIGYGFIGAILLAVLGVSLYLGEDAFIGDSAMRILWQLAQSTIAALAVLAGCMLLFHRKAGIVLLHLGIAGILLNEIYVTMTNEEHRVSFAEGETVHTAFDLRATEFVVLDRSNKDYDQITTIPGSLLFDSDEVIDDPQLPFKVRRVAYFKNSDVLQVGPHADNQATAGLGQSFLAVATKSASGADVDAAADRASAYVEIIKRGSESTEDQSLGVYLVSQTVFENGYADTIKVADKDYQIGLRYKTIYKPYSLSLKDTRAEYYVGTDIPSWFSSDFVINDVESGISSDQTIWMNNPLRYRDETFYQVRYSVGDDKTEYSGIQIVKNKGWMIPYVCCMFVVVGLVVQFQQSLSKFLTGSRTRTNASSSGEPDLGVVDARLVASNYPAGFKLWGPTLLLLGVFGLYYGKELAGSISPVVRKAKGSELRLDLLGKIPVTHGGRVQPLDTYARSTARKLSNREELKDQFEQKQPAIRWLADSMFGYPGYDEYEVLRIEDLSVQNALGFSYRKGMRYKFSEIRDANRQLIELLIESDKKPIEERTVFENRLREVYSKTRLLMGTQTAFFPPKRNLEDDDLLGRLEIAANLANTKSVMPFAIPTGQGDQPWLPLSLLEERRWLAEIALDTGNKTIEEMKNYLLERQMEIMKPELVKDQIIYELMQYEDIVEGLINKFQLKDRTQLAAVLSDNWSDFPPEIYKDEQKGAEAIVDRKLAFWRMSKDRDGNDKDQLVEGMLLDIFGKDATAIEAPDSKYADNLQGLKQAYLDNDAEKFNGILEKHLAFVEADAPTDFETTSHNWEVAYNHFSPFYVATVLYIVGFLVTILAWIGYRIPLNKAAFWIITFALLIHLGGIVARVVISGRPPITNLYSSFVVVAAGSVVILLIVEYATRIGLGNLLASVCGLLALLYAWTLSIDQGDTFTVLRAVLDTQFWLTTHVIIINLGYSATLVAGKLGIVFLIATLLTRIDQPVRKLIANIIYGIVCFALLFSFFGTVLGGLWADDSWGRFWGWDPKENGALMIVLWNALILHARWAGMIRERGLAALASFGTVITIWSWEGVNQLGVGLHAYGGVTSGSATGSLYMQPMFWLLTLVAFHIVIAVVAMMIPLKLYRSYSTN